MEAHIGQVHEEWANNQAVQDQTNGVHTESNHLSIVSGVLNRWAPFTLKETFGVYLR